MNTKPAKGLQSKRIKREGHYFGISVQTPNQSRSYDLKDLKGIIKIQKKSRNFKDLL